MGGRREGKWGYASDVCSSKKPVEENILSNKSKVKNINCVSRNDFHLLREQKLYLGNAKSSARQIRGFYI